MGDVIAGKAAKKVRAELNRRADAILERDDRIKQLEQSVADLSITRKERDAALTKLKASEEMRDRQMETVYKARAEADSLRAFADRFVSMEWTGKNLRDLRAALTAGNPNALRGTKPGATESPASREASPGEGAKDRGVNPDSRNRDGGRRENEPGPRGSAREAGLEPASRPVATHTPTQGGA